MDLLFASYEEAVAALRFFETHLWLQRSRGQVKERYSNGFYIGMKSKTRTLCAYLKSAHATPLLRGFVNSHNRNIRAFPTNSIGITHPPSSPQVAPLSPELAMVVRIELRLKKSEALKPRKIHLGNLPGLDVADLFDRNLCLVCGRPRWLKRNAHVSYLDLFMRRGLVDRRWLLSQLFTSVISVPQLTFRIRRIRL